jgi:hypothetical protein
MKYTFESSETEVTELYGLLGLIAKEVGKTVRHANELRARQPVPASRIVQSEVISSPDSDDTDADVIPFRRPSEVARSTEEEVEANMVYETEKWTAETPVSVAPVDTKMEKTIALGRVKFTDFITSWLVGIDHETMQLIDGVLQPNRELLLRDLCNSPYAHPTLEFVRSCGGLQKAIFEVTGSKYLGRRLPDFIVPPASIVFSDLSDTYEYVNPWKDEE